MSGEATAAIVIFAVAVLVLIYVNVNSSDESRIRSRSMEQPNASPIRLMPPSDSDNALYVENSAEMASGRQ